MTNNINNIICLFYHIYIYILTYVFGVKYYKLTPENFMLKHLPIFMVMQWLTKKRNIRYLQKGNEMLFVRIIY